MKFDLYNKTSFISRSSNGEEYITLVLNTTNKHRDGMQYTEEMLKDWARQINENPIIGDIDHKFYDRILKSNMSDEQVKRVLKNKSGIAKTIKAIYQKGKLWIRAIIDKRYRKIIRKAKGVSSEAFMTWGKNNKPTKGEVLGFTFNLLTTPAEYTAGVVA